MKIKEIMTETPIFIKPSESLVDAAKKMEEMDCGVLPVGEDSDHFIGMITDRDIVIRAVSKNKNIKGTNVKDVMSKGIQYCYEDDTLERCVDIMRDCRINRLLVKDRKEKVTGIVSFNQVLWKCDGKIDMAGILQKAASGW